MKLEFFRHISETQLRNFVKNRPLGTRLFDAGGRLDRRTEVCTDERDEDNNRFSQFFGHT